MTIVTSWWRICQLTCHTHQYIALVLESSWTFSNAEWHFSCHLKMSLLSPLIVLLHPMSLFPWISLSFILSSSFAFHSVMSIALALSQPYTFFNETSLSFSHYAIISMNIIVSYSIFVVSLSFCNAHYIDIVKPYTFFSLKQIYRFHLSSKVQSLSLDKVSTLMLIWRVLNFFF